MRNLIAILLVAIAAWSLAATPAFAQDSGDARTEKPPQLADDKKEARTTEGKTAARADKQNKTKTGKKRKDASAAEEDDAPELSEEELEQLKSMGYVQ